MCNINAGKKRILLVEDDEQSARYVEVLIQQAWDLVVAAWADDAWDIYKSQDIDLILMDISLPGNENGLELTRRIRDNETESHVPIIALTAHAFQQDRENSLAAGCDAYISKPFDKEILVSTIRQLI